MRSGEEGRGGSADGEALRLAGLPGLQTAPGLMLDVKCTCEEELRGKRMESWRTC